MAKRANRFRVSKARSTRYIRPAETTENRVSALQPVRSLEQRRPKLPFWKSQKARIYSVGPLGVRSIRRRKSRIPRPLTSPRSPGPSRQPYTPAVAPAAPERRVAFQLLPWKLTPLELEPPRLTRPTRILLDPWDIRVRRYTSPTGPWRYPNLLSPLPPSPAGKRDHGTQTSTVKVHRGVQVQPSTSDHAVQSDSDWEPTTSSKGVQTESPQVDENNNSCLGSLRVTKTLPPITYRERI